VKCCEGNGNWKTLNYAISLLISKLKISDLCSHGFLLSKLTTLGVVYWHYLLEIGRT
jgi:hypothetical protein